MAPEILRHEKYDVKADLWSVSAVYEMSVCDPNSRGTPLRTRGHKEALQDVEAESVKHLKRSLGSEVFVNSRFLSPVTRSIAVLVAGPSGGAA
ncbi:Serine/threonine-protein kinase ATG1 [Termitomyces sp. J132]|nr:hypothetical protein H2248_003855 [Termitomyces sp. 'cryptogamus']KAH0578731.1 hypothetical protein H2248_003858 [Termitomyces sp. 'cryptogamus']KNZ71324.1 Serine/threonine-protein kinase ATG1 [Termitomyces sp. J132]